MILALNTGSSSLKFGVYRPDERSSGTDHLVAQGMVSRIGFPDATAYLARVDEPAEVLTLPEQDHVQAAGVVLGWLDDRGLLHGLRAVGHRVVGRLTKRPADASSGSFRTASALATSVSRRGPLSLPPRARKQSALVEI